MGRALRLGLIGLALVAAIAATLAMLPGSECTAVFEGRTMGTRYRVVAIVDAPTVQADAGRVVDEELEAVDAALSSWRATSDVRRLNDSPGTDWLAVCALTVEAATIALDVARRCEGTYDPTVGPLVALWGFGPPGPPVDRPPDTAAIAAARRRVGWQKIVIRPDPPALRKTEPGVELDLSSVGEGIAADRIAAGFDRLGIERYLIDIGGEVRAGAGERGSAWQIAIDRPVAEAKAIQRQLPLQGASLATSGDYRQFFEHDGQRYSHLIDARSGWPVRGDLASVSVVADRCAVADAWATALMVVGAEAGIALAERHDLAAVFVVRRPRAFEERASTAFRRRFP